MEEELEKHFKEWKLTIWEYEHLKEVITLINEIDNENIFQTENTKK